MKLRLRPHRIAFLALAVLLALPAAAPASVGQFTRAWANPTWTQGSIAGSATWTDCQPSFSCKWFPYISVQPSLPSYSCTGNEFFEAGHGEEEDPNILIAWRGSQGAADGSVPFDLPNVYILQGVQGQRVCLSVVYGFWRQNPVCLAQQSVFPETECPFEEVIATKALASKLLEVEPPPSPTVTPPATTQPPTTPPKRHCPKGKRAIRRHGKVRCVKRHRRHH